MTTSPALVQHKLHLHQLGIVDVVMSRDIGPGSPLAVLHSRWMPSSPDDAVLVRVQSSCVYGEVLGSHDCDCRQQLDKAIGRIAEADGGIVVYLDQEGRGAGLFNKARGYELAQRDKVDSFTAYGALGLEPDLREYGGAAELLMALGVRRVRLLTNNPDKVTGLRTRGLEVEREPLVVEATDVNRGYLASKQARGHMLDDVLA